jgi:C4-dicarboxylate transporter, DctM subunit
MTSILAVLFALLLLGIPIFVALAGAVALFLGTATDVPLVIVPQRLFAGIDSFTLMAIPFFNLAAEVMRVGGLSDRLIAVARALVGAFPGGLAMASVLACMLFACISGSSPATVAAVGSILMPALVEAGYGERFSLGLVTTAGSLGILIPPSITFIIYGVVTGTSVGALFLAGVLPGIVVGLLLMAYSCVYAVRRRIPRDRLLSAREALGVLRDAAWVLGLPVVVFGGIYGGVFTPTEAAAVSAVYSLAVAMLVYRTIALAELPRLLARSGLASGTLLLIVAGASCFSWLIASQDIPQSVASALLAVADEKWSVLLVVNIVLLIAGCFVESASAIVILMPLFMPVAQRVGIDPIHLGVITVLNMEIGMVTPPVGLNLMVAKSMTGLPLPAIVRAALPSTLVLLLGLLLVTYVPPISLVLPRLLYEW